MIESKVITGFTIPVAAVFDVEIFLKTNEQQYAKKRIE